MENKQHCNKQPRVTEEIKEDIKKYEYENENTVIQNLWDAAKNF